MSERDRHEEERRPVEEAGGGEAEGFEQAEEELVEHASHGDQTPDPSQQAGDPEDASDAEYGEADHEETSERRSDDR